MQFYNKYKRLFNDISSFHNKAHLELMILKQAMFKKAETDLVDESDKFQIEDSALFSMFQNLIETYINLNDIISGEKQSSNEDFTDMVDEFLALSR